MSRTAIFVNILATITRACLIKFEIRLSDSLLDVTVREREFTGLSSKRTRALAELSSF